MRTRSEAVFHAAVVFVEGHMRTKGEMKVSPKVVGQAFDAAEQLAAEFEKRAERLDNPASEAAFNHAAGLQTGAVVVKVEGTVPSDTDLADALAKTRAAAGV